MNVNSNYYTFGFATIMVFIVAALLSYAYIELKPFQWTKEMMSDEAKLELGML